MSNSSDLGWYAYKAGSLQLPVHACGESFQESRMPGNPLVRFDEGRVGRTVCVALSPTLPPFARHFFQARLPCP